MARPPRYEGSPADERADRAGARKMGISKRAFENTAVDKAKDAAGQRVLDKGKVKMAAAAPPFAKKKRGR
jgi:hypothetical protein